jgi:hypothetical protein
MEHWAVFNYRTQWRNKQSFKNGIDSAQEVLRLVASTSASARLNK